MPAGPTLPSQQRARVLETYRGRGHRNSNVWLVYSIKQNLDLLMHSDRSLVHWLAFLETDPSVVGFRPITEELSAELKVGPASATLLERRNRQLEIHLLTDGQNATRTIETGVGPATVRAITGDELETHSKIALRWLKAISYAGLFRFRDMTVVSNQLAPCVMQRVQGTVDELFDELHGFDRAALYAALVTAAIRGIVELDLAPHGLCGASRWKQQPFQSW